MRVVSFPNMTLLKLRRLDDSTGGVTIPKSDLLMEGLLDGDGKLVKQPYLNVKRIDDGEWKIERVDDLPAARAAD